MQQLVYTHPAFVAFFNYTFCSTQHVALTTKIIIYHCSVGAVFTLHYITNYC